MDQTVIIVIIIFMAVIIFKIIRTAKFIKSGSANTDFRNKARPSDSQLPLKTVENDKLVLIKNLETGYLKTAIEQFCNLYNSESYVALPKLFIIDGQYVVTFPYDINFDRFCYFVNYLLNAHDLCLLPDFKPDVVAWCTTKKGDAWMKGGIVNKKVMIYIPAEDEEHDNVYLTTEDNIGFKMGFGIGEAGRLLENPPMLYQENPVDPDSLEDCQIIDFK